MSLFHLVEILRCSAFTAAVKLEMSVLSFLVMATPRKENKRCHLTTGQTPNEKKKNRPGEQIQGHIGSRKSLDYDSVEQNNEVSFLYVVLSTCLLFLCLYIMCLLSNVLVAFTMYQGSVAKESCCYLSSKMSRKEVPLDRS